MWDRHERPRAHRHDDADRARARLPVRPAQLVGARRHGPISRYTFPDGRQGRLSTGYDLTRSVLAGPRFGSRLAIPANQVPLRPEPPASTE
jgi:hypothetical protein